ncbi:hypothetical protein HN51_062050 [Arachis hypogaea]
MEVWCTKASIFKALLRYGKKQFAVDETRPSILKALLRYGKKQFAVDETRRDTRELSNITKHLTYIKQLEKLKS